MMLSIIKCLFCTHWDDHIVFFLYSVNVAYDIYWLVYIEPSLYPKDKSHLIMVNDPFDPIKFNLLVFCENFCTSVRWEYWLVILLSYSVLALHLGTRPNTISLEVFPPFQECLRWIVLVFRCLVKFRSKATRSCFFFFFWMGDFFLLLIQYISLFWSYFLFPDRLFVYKYIYLF
jgi:hypothetical protein